MGGFADSVRKNIEQVKQEVNTKINKMFVQIGYGIVYRGPSSFTRGPYADGLFTNQWYSQTGSGYSSMLTSQVSLAGSDSLQRINATAAESKEFLGKDGALTLANNVSYGMYVEYAGWPENTPGQHWKGALPYKMVYLTLQDVANKNK